MADPFATAWISPARHADDAAAVAQQLLLAGGSALAAVETAVNLLEDCPVLDAGVGSYLNAAGEIEMDALIMDGATLQMGAVAAVQRIRYPISLARRLLDEPKANFLVGIGAEAWADGLGFPRCTTAELIPGAGSRKAARARWAILSAQ
jgi:beta-aspartyl-peptidase (threonine type)